MDTPPPLYTTLYPSSVNFAEPPSHSPLPRHGIVSTESASVHQLLLSLLEQTTALRCDVLSRLPQPPLPPPAPSPASVNGTAPVDTHAAATTTARTVDVSSHLDADAWSHLLQQQQSIVDALSEALRLLVGQSPKNAAKSDKVSQTAYLAASETKGVDAGQQTDDKEIRNKVDLVDLLSAFYNSTDAQCGNCGTQLPHTIGEGIVAMVMGTTTHDVQDTYATLLVNQIKGHISLDSSHYRSHNARYANSTSGSATRWYTNDRAALRTDALVALPLPVASIVLRDVPFPFESIAYRMARSACDAHHRRQSNTIPLGASRWPASHVQTSRCRCSSADAAALLDSVRFLWLPLRFLEEEEEREQQRIGTGQCSMWAGLLLRLQQAARAKRQYVAQANECHRMVEPLRVELSRLRASYEFLTDWERQQLLDGVLFDVPRLLLLQKRCDGAAYPSAPE